MAAARFVVSGKVQGVFFRASTRQRAQALGLDGSATNLPDGTVEVVASGDAAALDALGAWLWTGPPASRVADVRREPAPELARGSGFDVA